MVTESLSQSQHSTLQSDSLITGTLTLSGATSEDVIVDHYKTICEIQRHIALSNFIKFVYIQVDGHCISLYLNQFRYEGLY